MSTGFTLYSRFQCRRQLKLSFILLILYVALIGCSPKPITLHPMAPTWLADDSSNKVNLRVGLCAFIDDRGVYLQSGYDGQPFNSSKDIGMRVTVQNTTVDQAVTDGVHAVLEAAGFAVEEVYLDTRPEGKGFPVISGKVLGFAGFYKPRFEVIGGSIVYRVVFELNVGFPGISEPYAQTYAGESASVYAALMTIPLKTPEQAANEALGEALEEMAKDTILFDKLRRLKVRYGLDEPTSNTTDSYESTELKPDDAAGYVKRGNAYYRSREYTKAISEYNKAIELYPAAAAAYYNRANSYGRLKRFEEAKKDFLKAVELDPALKPKIKNSSDYFKLNIELD